jgi:phytol kinase
MALFLTVVAVFAIVMASEIWWRARHVHGELSRKFIHLTVGSFVAFWPYYLSLTDIKLLSIAFVVVVALSKQFHIFQAERSVQRPTWGEVWFALSVGVLAFLIPHHPHIFTVALLEMSLADGLAAVIGTYWGNAHRYTVFGSAKSLLGTLTFLVVSCFIMLGYAHWTPGISLLPLLPVALIMTILENLASWGLDNAVVPLFTAGALLLIN